MTMPSSPTTPRHPRMRVGGFSLIELLCVLGIVALLASLLMPVLGTVRSLARSVRCAANEGQLGMSLRLYGAENRGLLIPCRVRMQESPPEWNYWGNGACWIDPWLIGTVVDGITVAQARRPPSASIFICPSLDRPAANGWGYGLGLNIFPGISNYLPWSESTRYRWNAVQSPERVALLSDTAGEFLWNAWPWWVPGAMPGQTISWNSPPDAAPNWWFGAHRRGAYLLFADLHVRHSPSPTAENLAQTILLKPW